MDDYKAIESGKDYLSHHGVKGMKWGIRHDPEPSGKSRTKASKDLGRAVRSTVRKVAKGLKRASRTSVRTAKRIRNRNLQRKIEKAIASGNSTRINKVFSKMNDVQAARAVVRINQREAVLRAKVEDGKRSLKNINMQRKIDTLNLRRQYNKAKHPNLYTAKDNAVNTGSKIITTKLSTAMSEAIINKAKKVATHPDKVVKEAEKAAASVGDPVKPNGPFDTSSAIDVQYKIVHSAFMDIGEDFIAHHGVKGMKWGIRHDEDRISNLKLKKEKNQSRLDKARGKKAKFNMKHRSLTAKKAEIRMARGKDPGLLGHLALTKSKKLDYKIAKLERKDAKLDKKISASKKKLNTRIETTKKIIGDAYSDAAFNAKVDKETAKQISDPIRKKELINEAKEYMKAADYYKNISVYDIDRPRYKKAKTLAKNYRKYDYPLYLMDKGKLW